MNILFTPSDNNRTSGAFRSMVALDVRIFVGTFGAIYGKGGKGR